MNSNAGEFTPSWMKKEEAPAPAAATAPGGLLPPRAPINIGKAKPGGGKPVTLGAAKPIGLPKAGGVSLPKAGEVSPPNAIGGLPKTFPANAAEEQTEATGAEENDDDEEVDENDPLWKITLEISGGDRKKAMKLLEDPDTLMSYPEVVAALEAAEIEGEDWDTGTSENPIAVAEKESLGTESATPTSTVQKSTIKIPKEVVDVEIDTGDAKDCDPREHLNLVFIGHVDAGKSTLSGSILYIMGMVDQRTIEKFEREAKQRNRDSWFLAFIMDTSEEERAKGKTVEVGRAYFHTDKNRYTILDAPGHKNYVPNMISGAAQADVGVLVISARKGEFETGFEKGGQTREHALLAKTLGIQYLVVVINKMDDPTVNWAKERYEECVSRLKPYLKSCGYVIKKDVKFVPISGITGDNVKEEVKPELCPWWNAMHTAGEHNTTDGTLMQIFDNLHIVGRNCDAPLRIPVLDRYYERSCVVLGKVESGTLTMGDEIIVAPTQKKVKVDAIFVGDDKVISAKPGENVLVKISCPVEDFQKGYVMCGTNDIVPTPRVFRCQLALIDMLEHRPIFSTGYDAILHVHTCEIEVQVQALVCIIDKGKKLKRPFARQGQQCIAEMRVSSNLNTSMERFEDFPALGRVTLRDEGKTIAIGKIIECK